MTVKKRMLIKGKKVHNVGYRPFLMEKAQELKILNFHAKNVKEDGWQVVDVRVGGEEGRINSFLKFARENSPEPAEVDNISVLEYFEDDIMTLEEYSQVFSALQLSKIVQTGLGMIGKQDETISVLKSGVEEMREFRTETQQNFATLDTKYGKVGENMVRILEEMKEERKESRESMEKILNAIFKLVEKSGR